MDESDVRQLVDACQRDDRMAQHALYQQYVGRVHGIARRMVGPNDVDDLTQNVFVQLFRSIRQYRSEARFETWLYRLIINEALQYRRRNRRWLIPSINEELLRSRPDHGGDDEDRELLDRALSALDPDLRTLFVLREVEGLSYRELAEVVGIPEGTVGSRLNRARFELRGAMVALGWEV